MCQIPASESVSVSGCCAGEQGEKGAGGLGEATPASTSASPSPAAFGGL